MIDKTACSQKFMPQVIGNFTFYQNLEYKLENVSGPQPWQCPPEVAKPWVGHLLYHPFKY